MTSDSSFWLDLSKTVVDDVYKIPLKALKIRAIKNFYNETIKDVLSLANHNPSLFLRTDLWNECIADTSVEKSFFVGMDLSLYVCRLASQNLDVVIRADIRKLPFREGTFDAIIDVSTIDHVDPFEMLAVLKEYYKILKKGRFLFLCVDSKLSLFWEMYRKLFVRYSQWSVIPSHFKRMLNIIGFHIIKEYFTGQLLSLLSKKILKLEKSPLSRFFLGIQQFYVVLCKKPEG